MTFTLLFLVVALAGAVLWMAGGVQSTRVGEDRIGEIASATTSTSTASLDVLVWNIAWGYGWGSEGSGTRKPDEHFERALAKIADVIRASNADLVLLQEVDFGATRSGGVDQVQLLAERAGLKYVAYAESWTANWVPFPYWPFADQFGRMRSGGAVLSRFPIERNEVRLLAKPAENPFWYNLFYPFRYLQTLDVRFGGDTLRVYNTHLEAFSRANRIEQAEQIAAAITVEDAPFTIFGGDLNAVPPESSLAKGYPDEPDTDHEGDVTIATMRSIDGLTPTVSGSTFTADEAAHFTFPAHAPNRRLDHLFVSKGLRVEAAGVLREAGDVSDHLPIFARLTVLRGR